MHRHGYKGRKLGRERDQRRSLMKGLAESLIIYESIETTLPKAKELVPYVEKLITKAKKADLHSRRQIISSLHTTSSAHKLVDEIAPRFKDRSSGHLRIKRTTSRRGDNAQLAAVGFVEIAKETAKATDSKDVGRQEQAVETAKPANRKTLSKKPLAKEAKK